MYYLCLRRSAPVTHCADRRDATYLLQYTSPHKCGDLDDLSAPIQRDDRSHRRGVVWYRIVSHEPCNAAVMLSAAIELAAYMLAALGGYTAAAAY